MGPFSPDTSDTDLHETIWLTSRFSISYSVYSVIPHEADMPSDCYEWDLYQRFDFTKRSFITLQLDFEQKTCPHAKEISWQNKVWLHFFVLICSIASLVFSIKYINDIASTYKRLSTQYRSHRKRHHAHLKDQREEILKQNLEYKKTIVQIKKRNTMAQGAD